MSEYSIRELEKLSGIKAHTIRVWEKRYNLVNPKRTSTNIRFYSDEDLKKLLNISILNRNGLKISKIACLRNEELANQVTSFTHDTRNYETQIENLLISMIELDESKFEKHLSKCIIQMGFEDTILEVVYPFLIRIGLLWQTGKVNPAQEHFISNLVRQKIIVAIDGVIPVYNNNAKKFILFLPEGELHELALLFMYYLIKKRGHKVLYLGQSVPDADARSVQDFFHADYLITYYTSPIQQGNFKKQLLELSLLFNDASVLIAGIQTELSDYIPEKNIIKISTLNQLIDLIENHDNISNELLIN